MNTTIPRHTLVLIFTALMVVALTGYASFVESGKEKTVQGVIGTLSVKVVPHTNSVGTETVAIKLNAPGNWNFTGWKIESGDFSHTIVADAIEEGQTLLLCGTPAAGYDCTEVWGGTDVFADIDGEFVLRDLSGNVISRIAYTSPGVGGVVADTPALITTILSNNAAVHFCRATNQGGFTEHRGNVSTIVDGKAHADITGGSIIPSFYYDSGSEIRFYEGLNWPDMTGIFSNGCL